MKEYSTQNIRNVALASHSGSGKTMLAEAMLFSSGAITRMGEINAGSTVSDYQDEEKRRHQPQRRMDEIARGHNHHG